MKKLVLLEIRGKLYGLELRLVRGIHKANTLIEQFSVGGDMYVREPDGENMPLFDLSAILDGSLVEGPPGGEIVLVNLETHSLGLKVGKVNRVVSVEPGRIEPLPSVFRQPSLSCFPHVLKHEGELVLLLDPEGIEGLDFEFLIPEYRKPEPEVRETETSREDDIIELMEVVESVPEQSETQAHEIRGAVAKLHAEEEDSRIVADDLLEDIDREFGGTEEPDLFPFDGELVTRDDLPPENEGGEPEETTAKLEAVMVDVLSETKYSEIIIDKFTGLIESAVEKEIEKMRQSGALSVETVEAELKRYYEESES